MTCRRTSVCAALLLLVATSRGLGVEPISLAPRFEFGAKTHYVSRSIVRNEIKADLLETAENVVLNSESGMSLLVSEVDSNGSAELVWTQLYVTISTDEPFPGIDGKLDYDSRDPTTSSSPIAPAFAAWVGKPIRMRVDRSGRVVSFKAPNVNTGAGPAAQLAASFFSKEAFAQLPFFITRGSPALVSVRQNWSRRQKIEIPTAGVGLDILQNFTMSRLRPRRQSALLDMKGSISGAATAGASTANASTAGPSAASGGLPGGAALEVESGSVRGTFEWDYANGTLINGESQLELTTHLDTRVGRMNLSQKMTASIKRVSERELERRTRQGSKRRKRGDR